jgi:hypothetical protein
MVIMVAWGATRANCHIHLGSTAPTTCAPSGSASSSTTMNLALRPGVSALGPEEFGVHEPEAAISPPDAGNRTGHDSVLQALGEEGSLTHNDSATPPALDDKHSTTTPPAQGSGTTETRPIIRAQRGIHQPRISTYGTIKYGKCGFLTSSDNLIQLMML